jgi:dynein heavy chain
MDAKNLLEQKAAKTKKKINTARTLIYSLSGEKERWNKGAQEIGEQKRRLVGNASLSAAFISYCGAFNAEFRSRLANDSFTGDMKKKQVPVSPGLDLTAFLVDEATIGEWNLQGLPKDDLSIQNGIMVTNSSRYPLFIDPQAQGSAWIKNKYEQSIDPNRSIATLTHPKFKDFFLKYCMEEGKTLIIENIENEVDPMLDPVLDRQVQVKGKTRFIDVGGT